jgi:hypothetical protein
LSGTAVGLDSARDFEFYHSIIKEAIQVVQLMVVILLRCPFLLKIKPRELGYLSSTSNSKAGK